jgi:hypothetical protein
MFWAMDGKRLTYWRVGAAKDAQIDGEGFPQMEGRTRFEISNQAEFLVFLALFGRRPNSARRRKPRE